MIIDENDPQKIKKIKQRLTRKQSEKIRLQKAASSYFNNEFLENLSQQLGLVGVSGFTINKFLINWISKGNKSESFDLQAPGEELKIIYSNLSNHFLNSLNGASRQLCNDILCAADSICETNRFQKKTGKLRRSKRRSATNSIDQYAQK